MSDKPKIKFKWLEKLKNIKHIEFIVLAIFVVIILLIYGSTFKKKSNSKTSQISYEGSNNMNGYLEKLERDLEGTISQIKGVSNAKVLITLNMSNATIANNEIQTNTFPDIQGVVVVAKGVEDTSVKLNVLKAVEAVLNISTGCIEILSAN